MRASPMVDCVNQYREGVFWKAEDKRIRWTCSEARCVDYFALGSGRSGSYAMPDCVGGFPSRKGRGVVGVSDDCVPLRDKVEGTSERLLFEFGLCRHSDELSYSVGTHA